MAAIRDENDPESAHATSADNPDERLAFGHPASIQGRERVGQRKRDRMGGTWGGVTWAEGNPRWLLPCAGASLRGNDSSAVQDTLGDSLKHSAKRAGPSLPRLVGLHVGPVRPTPPAVSSVLATDFAPLSLI